MKMYLLFSRYNQCATLSYKLAYAGRGVSFIGFSKEKKNLFGSLQTILDNANVSKYDERDVEGRFSLEPEEFNNDIEQCRKALLPDGVGYYDINGCFVGDVDSDLESGVHLTLGDEYIRLQEVEVEHYTDVDEELDYSEKRVKIKGAEFGDFTLSESDFSLATVESVSTRLPFTPKINVR